MQFHREPQDTECAVWKRLLEMVEDAAAAAHQELDLLRLSSDAAERRQLVTLPASIAKLTSVKNTYRRWVSLRIATDVLPLLVNACSETCLSLIPPAPPRHRQHPHCGGAEPQPAKP